MEVIYQGIRLTPEEIAESALQEDVDVVGLSILSGSHLELVPEVVRRLRDEGVDVPVVVGGIIPAADAERLREAGVAGVYTPKDFDINRIMGEIVDLVEQRADTPAPRLERVYVRFFAVSGRLSAVNLHFMVLDGSAYAHFLAAGPA